MISGKSLTSLSLLPFPYSGVMIVCTSSSGHGSNKSDLYKAPRTYQQVMSMTYYWCVLLLVYGCVLHTARPWALQVWHHKNLTVKSVANADITVKALRGGQEQVFKSMSCHLPAVWPWVGSMTSLAFPLFICKWRSFQCPLCAMIGRIKRGQAGEVKSLPGAVVRVQPGVSIRLTDSH